MVDEISLLSHLEQRREISQERVVTCCLAFLMRDFSISFAPLIAVEMTLSTHTTIVCSLLFFISMVDDRAMVDRSLRDDVLAAIDIVDVAGRYVQLKRV